MKIPRVMISANSLAVQNYIALIKPPNKAPYLFIFLKAFNFQKLRVNGNRTKVVTTENINSQVKGREKETGNRVSLLTPLILCSMVYLLQ